MGAVDSLLGTAVMIGFMACPCLIIAGLIGVWLISISRKDRYERTGRCGACRGTGRYHTPEHQQWSCGFCRGTGRANTY
ncbi:hypothetical protein Q0Z83_023440 [Actinoplanes sichuanensis]|nr:hypothetical protein Q0Z83_023440 [Actinoplanes sichuanensis]